MGKIMRKKHELKRVEDLKSKDERNDGTDLKQLFFPLSRCFWPGWEESGGHALLLAKQMKV